MPPLPPSLPAMPWAPMAAEPALQRAKGRAEIGFKRRGAATVLATMDQAGCAKLRLPRAHDLGTTEAVLLNTAGGLTGGDRFDVRAHWQAGTAASVTTAAAERLYRAAPGAAPAHLTARLQIEAGAWAEWLPQETILFDGARVTRRVTVDLPDDAGLIAVDAWMIGRTAMGERVTSGQVRDHWRVYRGGDLVFADGLRLEGNIAECLERVAIAGGQPLLATLLVVHKDAGATLDGLRACLDAPALRVGCSAIEGGLVVRLLGDAAEPLRAGLGAAVGYLRARLAGLPARMPQVWRC